MSRVRAGRPCAIPSGLHNNRVFTASLGFFQAQPLTASSLLRALVTSCQLASRHYCFSSVGAALSLILCADSPPSRVLPPAPALCVAVHAYAGDGPPLPPLAGQPQLFPAFSHQADLTHPEG